MPYLDTSVLGSYYCPETLSALVNQTLASVTDSVISPLVELEFVSLLAIKIRTKTMKRSTATAALGQFRMHQADGIYRSVEIGSREYDLARSWLGGFVTSLRTLDALHLATAFANRQTLLTTDRTLAAAAAQLRVAHQLIEH